MALQRKLFGSGLWTNQVIDHVKIVTTCRASTESMKMQTITQTNAKPTLCLCGLNVSFSKDFCGCTHIETKRANMLPAYCKYVWYFSTRTLFLGCESPPNVFMAMTISLSASANNEKWFSTIPAESRKLVIWVGYEQRGRHFVDKVIMSGRAQTKLHYLQTWWIDSIPRRERLVRCFVFCQSPIVAIGSLPVISICHQSRVPDGDWHSSTYLPAAAMESRGFPHETQFSSLEKNNLLTRGFFNPASMIDEAEFFERDKTFNVKTDHESGVVMRHVLFVGWEVDKRYLGYQLLAALTVVAVVAVSVAISLRNFATGAQVGGTLSGFVVAIFGYIIWRCA